MQSLSENIISIKKSDIDFVKKCEYEFCNNNMVNDDFFNYLKFLKNRDWLFMGTILEKMENKTKLKRKRRVARETQLILQQRYIVFMQQ